MQISLFSKTRVALSLVLALSVLSGCNEESTVSIQDSQSPDSVSEQPGATSDNGNVADSNVAIAANFGNSAEHDTSPTRFFDGTLTTGTDATSPWAVSIQTDAHICSGALISPQWILTASQCGQTGASTPLKVVKNSGKSLKVENVQRVVAHPDSETSIDTEHLALIRLENPVAHAGEYISLPPKDVLIAVPQPELGAETIFVDTKRLSAVDNFQEMDNGTETWDEVSCDQDNGNPIVFQHKNKSYLFGIATTANSCDPDVASANTLSAMAQLEWIQQTLSESGSATPPAFNSTSSLSNIPVSKPMALQKSVPLAQFGAGANSDKYLGFYVNEDNASNLSVNLQGGTGDANLLLRYFDTSNPEITYPDLASSDCAPMLVGNNEACVITEPKKGWYLMTITSDIGYADVNVLADFQSANNVALNFAIDAGNPEILENEGELILNAAAGQKKYFRFDVPQNSGALSISLANGTGDADLYVKKGQIASKTVYDCRPFQQGNMETCTAMTSAGTYYIMIDAPQAYQDVSLVAKVEKSATNAVGVVSISNNTKLENMVFKADEVRGFKIDVPADAQQLRINLWGENGNADLFVRKGAFAEGTNYDCGSTTDNSYEECIIANPDEATYYVTVVAKGETATLNLLSRIQSKSTIDAAGIKTMENNTKFDNMAFKANEVRGFTIKVPANTTNLRLNLWGTGGDADLFVRKGAFAEGMTYDCGSAGNTNYEECIIAKPDAATYYVSVVARDKAATLNLLSRYQTGNTGTAEANASVMMNNTKFENMAFTADQARAFKIDVPANQAYLRVNLWGENGNADLYVRRGAVAQGTTYDCASTTNNSYEECIINNPQADTYYITVASPKAASTLNLLTRYGTNAGNTGGGNLVSGTRLNMPQGQWKYYSFAGNGNSTRVKIDMGTGDTALYVRSGEVPTGQLFDCKSDTPGQTLATCDIATVNGTTYYIGIWSNQTVDNALINLISL